MKRFKRMSVFCLTLAVIFAAVGAYLAVARRHVDDDAKVAFFYAGVFPLFAAVARVIERATPPSE